MADRSVAAAAGPTPNRSALADSIRLRAGEFDVDALLSLLRAKFPDWSIRFRTHPSQALRGSPVHAVQFEAGEIIVTLNLGFCSSTSPLPSYVHEWLVGIEPVSGLDAILGVLNDRLLRDRGDASLVNESERLVPRVAALRENLLGLARPASTATLYWVFSRIFPELGVSVVRAGVRRALAAAEPRLGEARLGHAAMGGSAALRSPGYDVFLCASESLTWRGEPWSDQARRRLSEIALPVLAESAPELRILLLDFEGSARLSLVRSSSLGFEPLTRASLPHTVVLYEGRVEVTQ